MKLQYLLSSSLKLVILILSIKSMLVNGQDSSNINIEKYLSNNDFNEVKADSILNLISKDSLYFANTSFKISRFFYKKKRNYRLAIKYANLELEVLKKKR